jgi:hypothetical protein
MCLYIFLFIANTLSYKLQESHTVQTTKPIKPSRQLQQLTNKTDQHQPPTIMHTRWYVCKRVTPRSVLFAPSTRRVLMPTLRQTHVIASHMGTSSVDRALLLLKRRIEERRRLGCLHEFIINIDFVLILLSMQEGHLSKIIFQKKKMLSTPVREAWAAQSLL